MTEADKWKARAEQVYAHIYLDVPAGHHLHETNIATLKAALAAAYAAGREDEREACAKIVQECESKVSPDCAGESPYVFTGIGVACDWIAAAIRARGASHD